MVRCLLLLLIFLRIDGLPTLAADSLLPDGEALFIQQLRLRGLYEIAENYCLRRQAEAKHPGIQAEWELLLADCCSDHAWLLAESDRMQLIRSAVQRITDRLRNLPPSPELNIQLRVRQVELLNAVGKMEATPLGFGGSSPAEAAALLTGLDPPPTRIRFAVDACQQGYDLAESLLTQLSSVRRDLSPAFVRTVRLSTQLAQAELQYSLLQLGGSSASASARTKLLEKSEQLTRSSINAERFRARCLVARLAPDQQTFDLRYRSLLADAETPQQRMQAELLRVRALLNAHQPTEALRLLTESENFPDSQLNLPEPGLMQLQCQLQITELLLLLENPSAERQEALLNTSTEAKRLINELQNGLSGIWSECVQRCRQRLELALRAGPAAASQLEEAHLLATSGKYQAARELLLGILQRADRDVSLSAFASQQAGDLALQLRDWSAASEDLNRAREKYSLLSNQKAAAQADTLRIFALGQLWLETPNEDESQQAELRYRQAMLEHVDAFADTAETTTVRHYLARYFRNEQPLLAAEYLLPVCQQAENRYTGENSATALGEFADSLNQLADLLIRHAGLGELSEDGSAEADAIHEYQRMARTILQTQPDSALSAIRLLRIQFETGILWSRADASEPRDWPARESAVSSALGSPVTIITPPDTASADERNQWLRAVTAAQGLVVLCKLRQLLPPEEYQQITDALLLLPRNFRDELVQLLAPQLRSAEKHGQKQLSELLLQLLAADSENAQGADVSPILRLRLAALAGDSALVTREIETLTPLIPKFAPQDRTELVQDLVSISLSDALTNKQLRQPFQQFWLHVQQVTPAGQNDWLEASLQLARIAVLSGNRQEASRIIGVVDVLHPTWGSAERLQRVRKLRQQLESDR